MATSKPVNQQEQSNLKWVADFIWNIADGRLRDVYVRGKYRDVILPFTVLRRLDAVLESTKHAVLERKKFLDTHKVAEQDGALRMASGQAFYNTSEFTLATLSSSGQGQRLPAPIRADGYAVSREELIAGAIAMAAPVFMAGQQVVGSLAVYGPSVRIGEKQISHISELLLKASTQLSQSLGA